MVVIADAEIPLPSLTVTVYGVVVVGDAVGLAIVEAFNPVVGDQE
jgi:hypothetical protein